ncbi:helix-turn-helix domain-containing protein [Aquimarina sp. W85]|uniref:helix-turn-helix domain-containing protein n=1 Tax=Aquimarina rhodophyticola TaxID=3342246 RepID=UPI00366D6E29
MQQYHFDFSNLDILRDYFRNILDPNGTDYTINFPEEIGEGYLSYYKISPEVYLLINNYKANDDLEFIRNPIDESDIILHFRKYALTHSLKNNIITSHYNNAYTPGNMRCMDATKGERVFIPKGAEIRSTMIVLKSTYTKPYFMKSHTTAQNLDTYIKYTHQFIDKFYLSYRQSVLFDQIVSPNYDTIENELYFIARGINLLETFWKDIVKFDTDNNPFAINAKQVGNIYKISHYLENNLFEPFIGVDQLALMAFMSRTNFFNMFKDIHNQTPLEYFNNKRLESAYTMVFSEGIAVKEVMNTLNYSNSSKFRKAFYNKFNVYPDGATTVK